jgi:hypothetical protein
MRGQKTKMIFAIGKIFGCMDILYNSKYWWVLQKAAKLIRRK